MENGKKEGPFQLLKRAAAIVVCTAFVAWRAYQFETFWSKTLWGLETALYGVLLWNYLTRLPAVSPAAGGRDLVAPYFIAALPFAVFVLPVDAAMQRWQFLAGQGLLLVGTALTVVAMATLRRSFSISVEARAPVLRGVYRFVRHPVYLGEFISVMGVGLIRLSPLSVALVGAFIVLQTLRAGWEEQKLAATFPEYAQYHARTGMFLPRMGTRSWRGGGPGAAKKPQT